SRRVLPHHADKCLRCNIPCAELGDHALAPSKPRPMFCGVGREMPAIAATIDLQREKLAIRCAFQYVAAQHWKGREYTMHPSREGKDLVILVEPIAQAFGIGIAIAIGARLHDRVLDFLIISS